MKNLFRVLLFGLNVSLHSCGSSDAKKDPSALNQQMGQVKIASFNNVEQLQNVLSQNGIGNLRKWHGDELGFMSSSEYFPFGGRSSENGMQNNLAYYLESPSVKYVQQMKLMLNVNNKAEQVKALAIYSDAVEKTFKSVGLELPNGLLEACKSGKEFKSNQSQFSVASDLSKSKIDTWKLTICSK